MIYDGSLLVESVVQSWTRNKRVLVERRRESERIFALAKTLKETGGRERRSLFTKGNTRDSCNDFFFLRVTLFLRPTITNASREIFSLGAIARSHVIACAERTRRAVHERRSQLVPGRGLLEHNESARRKCIQSI